MRILDRLKMKKIIVVSSAPQIRYPDCYGIDMSKMGDFVAFEAAVSLIREQADGEALLSSIYRGGESGFGETGERIEKRGEAVI